MPKKKAAKSKKANGIPKYGRPEADVRKDIGLQSFAADVPLGNTDPTVVRGVMYGGMPNFSRMARGNLRTYKGKYT